jgi:small GTP-binding protein
MAVNNFRVVTAGPSGCGKTGIVQQFVFNRFPDGSEPTVGVEFHRSDLGLGNEHHSLALWDTAGQERYRSISKAYFRDAVAALLVFDLTYRKSLEALNQWLADLRALCHPNVYILLVGNKSDLQDERRVEDDAARDFALQNHLDYLEVSAKSGHNVREAFIQLTRGILNRINSESIEPRVLIAPTP